MTPTEQNSITMLADRIIKLNVRLAALQSLLTPAQNAEYSEFVEQNEQLFLLLPEELAWKRTLQQRPAGD